VKFEFSPYAASSKPLTVAQQYPARPQDGGGYLFRPKYPGRKPPEMWGWTASLDLAHPDYFKEGDVPRGCQRVEINGRQVLVHLADVEKPLSEGDLAAINEYATFLESKGTNADTAATTAIRDKTEQVYEEIPNLEGFENPDVAMATPEDVAEVEEAYGQTIEELADEAERGYDTQPTVTVRGQIMPPTNEGDPVTELTMTGPDTGRYTEHMRYRLPPELERAEVKFDGYKRYKLPSPSTGKLTAFTRSTTVSSTTADTYNLQLWKQRTKIMAVLIAKACSELVTAFDPTDYDTPADAIDARKEFHVEMFGRDVWGGEVEALADLYIELLDAYADGKAQDPNKKIDAIDNYVGGAEAREHGQAVHEWLGAVDSGQVLLWQVPEEYVMHVTAYQDCLKRAGLIAVPIYVERIVINDYGEETVAGTIDRIYYCVETGELYLGDLKTSKTLEWSALEYGIQFAIYGFSRLMLRLDGTGWDDMPEINQEQCFCVHVPSDQPERSQVVPFYLYPGGEFAVTAIEVRKQRKEADKKIFGGAYPIPSVESLRYVDARQALQNVRDFADAQRIMAEYEDVWDDDLMAFGATCFEAISTSTSTDNEGN
jgi:hypothetical protein